MQALKIFGVLLASSILQGNEALRGHSFLELEEKQLSSANNNYARNEYGGKSEVENECICIEYNYITAKKRFL